MGDWEEKFFWTPQTKVRKNRKTEARETPQIPSQEQNEATDKNPVKESSQVEYHSNI